MKINIFVAIMALGQQGSSIFTGLHSFCQVRLNRPLGFILIFLTLKVASDFQVLVDRLAEVLLSFFMLLNDLLRLLNGFDCLAFDTVGSLEGPPHLDIYFVVMSKELLRKSFLFRRCHLRWRLVDIFHSRSHIFGVNLHTSDTRATLLLRYLMNFLFIDDLGGDIFFIGLIGVLVFFVLSLILVNSFINDIHRSFIDDIESLLNLLRCSYCFTNFVTYSMVMSPTFFKGDRMCHLLINLF